MSTSPALHWVGLIGVALGFILGEGSRYARYRWEVCQKKKILRAELETVILQIPQKIDILQQAIGHLKQKHFMPTLSVHSVTSGYYAVREALYPHLTIAERNCLHVIFERLRIADNQMDGFEESFLRAIKEKVIEDPWPVYMGRLEELIQSYSTVEELTRSYLAKKSIDVFGFTQKK